MIKNYFKTAFRSLWKNRVTSAINITGLAVGMTAAVLILLWVKNEMNFDDYHRDEKNIYRLTSRINANNWIWESTPLLLADAIKRELPEIENATRLNTNHWPVFTVNDNTFYQKECAYVDSNWFSMFDVKFLEGNATSFGKHISSVILSASAAKKYFGTKPAVGQQLIIDKVTCEVTGVIADPPVNSSFQYHAFIPLGALLTDPDRKQNDEQWGNYNYFTFVKLKTGGRQEAVAAKISDILKKNDKEASTSISLISLKDMHFESEIEHSSFRHGNINTVYIFSILAFLLLLIACINYVNLTTAKASLRAKEVSIRKMTGASRSHLFGQFIVESLLISVIALLVTICLVQVCLPAFNELTGRNFVLSLKSTALWQTTSFTLVVAFLLNSIYPALILSSFNPMNVFRGATVLKVKDSYFRKGLVVLQFTVSVILIAGTIIIYSQMNFIRKTNPGYNRSEVVSIAIPMSVGRENQVTLMQKIKQQLASNSSITGVTVCSQPLVDIGSVCTECVDWEGRDTAMNQQLARTKVSQLSVDADFQRTMQLQLKEGRWFSGENTADKHNVVLNETAITEFGLEEPVVGKRFIFKGDTGTVIGVVKDFKFKSMHEKTGPLVAFNNQMWGNHFMVRTGAGNASTAVAAIENIWKQNFPGTPLEYNFLDDTFNNLYKEDQQASFLVMVFALIAVVISAMGLFSLAAFSAEQRTKEIGIRKVLGANASSLTALLSKDFLKLVMIALLMAIPVAYWAMSKWLQDFAYKIDISWWMFAAAGLLAIFIALFTVSFQAIKAAIANPVKSLRTE